MHKKARSICIFILIAIFIIWGSFKVRKNTVYSHNDSNKSFNVLVLNSYHQNHKFEADILEGLNEYIENNINSGINFKVEYIDFKNNDDEKYIKSLKTMLNQKYPKGSIDAIYTVNDEAYDIFNKDVLDKNNNFYKVALLFSGLDFKESINAKEKKYMAGIYHGDDSLNLMNLIMDLTPEVKSINLITENSKYGESVKNEINSFVETYLKGEIKINYISSNYIQEITNKIKNIKKNGQNINIIAGEFQYENSRKYLSSKEVVNAIKKYSKDPIYSNDASYMEAGIIGGYMDMGKYQAQIICNMIEKLKKGIKISDIENVREPVAQGYIDYKSVYQHPINLLNISKDIDIINKPFYELLIPIWAKKIIIAILVGFIAIILVGIKIISRHIKENKKRERENKIAKEREKLKSDFIVNLSHELRTPINVILGISKVLECGAKKESLDKNDILTKLESINLNSYRLLKISNNIIDMSKAESGMLKLNLEHCNIVNIVEDVFDSSIEFANRKNINMTFDTVFEEIKAAVDVIQIRRVVLNLLSNAIKFTPENGNINLFMWNELDNVVIEVIDTGVGIPKEKLNEIFHSFYQIESLYTRSNEGSGIGLSIIKEIIQIHGGKIEVESEVGEGSSFRIYIPMNLDNTTPEHNPLRCEDINRMVKLEMSDI